MRRMIGSVVVSVLLGGFTVAAAQLPPEIMADSYLLQAEQAVRDGDQARALAAINNILDLQNEHELDLPDDFHFKYAQVTFSAGLNEAAIDSVNEYLAAAGRTGEFYREALELFDEAEQNLPENVAAAQLPPEIMVDRDLLRAERLIAEEDYKTALEVMNQIVSLQEEHDLTLPEEFHFKYAQVAALDDLPDQALAAVVKYLAAAGRDGEHYVAALELMNTAQVAVSCAAAWNTEEYFQTAAVEDVTGCLAAGTDPTAKSRIERTPLHAAASYTNDPAVVETLLAAGADVNARDDVGRTPLHAAAGNDLAVVEVLLTAGADPMARDEDGNTPLHAAAGNDLAVVEVLLTTGADPMEGNSDGETPLHAAAEYNDNPAVIEALLEVGAEVNARTNGGETPLHLAAWNNNPAVREVLMAAEAEQTERRQRSAVLCEQGAWNTEAFFRAATVEDVTACLAAGADLEEEADDDYRPLHTAARYNDNPAVIEALVAAGADLEAKSDNGFWSVEVDQQTPLHLAAEFNEKPAVIEALVAAGADLEAEAYEDYRPLHMAAWYNNNPAVIEALVAAGADLEARNENSRTPLHLAAKYNDNPAVVQALLTAGADVMSGGFANVTPLHLAARYNDNPAVIEVLVAAGADPEMVTGSGIKGDNETPLKWAGKNDNPAVREALLRAGAGQTERQRAAERARRKANSGPGLFDFAVAAIGGTAIAAAGGGTDEAVAAGGVFAEGVLSGNPSAGNGGWIGPGRVRTRWQHGGRGTVPGSELSEPARWRGEPGFFMVSSERWHAAAFIRAPGGGGAVCDRYGQLFHAGANQHETPGDQRGLR